MPPTHEELFERWQKRRDARALGELFDRTAPEVWRIAWHLTRDRTEADDLLQATFLAAIESAPRYVPTQPVLPWLLGILLNKVRMVRRRARRVMPAGVLERPAPLDPAASAEAVELAATLRRCVDDLPETYRAVLVLQLEHGLTAAEIANALGRPRGTVRSQLSRGVELLRQALPALVLALPGRAALAQGLAAARAQVLAHASGVGGGGIALGALGGWIMGKKVVLAAAVALSVAGVWFAWPGSPVARVPAGGDAVGAGAGPVLAGASSPLAANDVRREVVKVATATPQRGGLRVRVRWADGSAAPAMGVSFEPDAAAHGWFARREAITDGGGMATCADLPAGATTVSAGHGGRARAEVGPGIVGDVDVMIPAGVDVRGVVVDRDGTPVPEAELLLGDYSRTATIGTTDGYGRFALRSIDPQLKIAAQTIDHCPSEFAVPGPDLQLRLGPPAGVVVGRVLDAAGLPIAGAWVQAGFGFGSEIPPSCVRSGHDGGFRVSGLRPGMRWPLQVGAQRFGVSRTWLVCERGQATQVEVRLDAEVVLRGRVRRADGVAIARPRLRVRDATEPPSGVADQRPFWMQPLPRVSGDGSFLCRNLPPGLILVDASESDGAWACAAFTAVPGAELEWNPLLARGEPIRGTLRDVDATPLSGWRITAESVAGRLSTTTDSSGGFELRGCPSVAHKVTCQATGIWGHPLAEARGVLPGAADLELRAAAPSCVVVGRIAAAGLPANAEVRVSATDALGGRLDVGPKRPGATFEVGPLPPLTLTWAAHCGTLRVALGTHRLVPGQRLDLGDVEFAAPGRVNIEALEVAGQPVAAGSFRLAMRGERAWAPEVQVREGHGTAEVSPGTYVAFAAGADSWEHASFEVRSGETIEVQVRRAATWRRMFRYDLTALGLRRRCVAQWHKGGVVMAQSWFDFWRDEPAEVDHWFSTGDWQLELVFPDGVTHWFPFRVDATALAPPIEIRVR